MSGKTPGHLTCIAWNEHYAEQHGIEARNEWAASDPRGRAAWEAAAKAGHAAIAAQQPQPAPGLRDALAELVADWREGSEYRVTDTRDEMTENSAVRACADSVAQILDEHPDTPRPAPGLADAMAEARELRDVLAEVLASISSGEFVATASAHLNKLGRWYKRAGIEWP